MTSDAATPADLTERQERILDLIVRGYIEKGHPISSKALTAPLGVSSATVRNEMAVLEAAGYIASPHTSAGRVPTEAGYRYFVQCLLDEVGLSAVERRMISHQFHQAPLDIDQWMRLSAAVLARTAQSASLITPPRSHISRFKHLELIETQGRLVLMVLVLHNGDVRQRMLTLAEPVSQEQLSQVAARLTHCAVGLSAARIRDRQIDLPALDREVLELVANIMTQVDSTHPQIIYHDGLVELFGQFGESEGAQQALRVLEEQTMLEALLREAVGPTVGSVRVVIAGEGRWDDLNLLSIVLGRYGVDGRATGTLGVLGPVRMSYGRAVGAVRFVAGLMSNLLIEVYGEDSPTPLS